MIQCCSLLEHPLVSTLREKANLCIRNQKSQYQRHLTPVGVKTIIKEERCYLPDGTIYELRDIWTADSITEEEVFFVRYARYVCYK